MALITGDELARGAILVVFGGAAGSLAMAFPGSLWWTVPAIVGGVCGAATVPEVRDEMLRAAPQLQDEAARVRAALPFGQKPPRRGRTHPTTPAAVGAPPAAASPARAPRTTPIRERTAPQRPEDAVLERGRELLRRPLYDSDPTVAWGPTIIAAQSRWGKSQVQIGRLAEDVASGHETVWMSTHATLYHPKDQPTDLRPIADRFEAITDGDEIRDRLNFYVNEVLPPRLKRYTRGEDVGHTIALHIGEWPALYAAYGDEVAAPMRRLIREAPKAQIIVSSLDAQDAHVQTLGLGSGVRANFWTKLIGRVDERTWEVLAGPGVPYQILPARTWYAPGVGLLRFPLTPPERIAQIAGGAEETPAPVEEAPPAAAPQRQRKVAAAEGGRPAVVSARVPAPDPLLAGLLAGEHERRPAPAQAPSDDIFAHLSPERADRLRAIRAAQPQPAPAPVDEAPPVAPVSQSFEVEDGAREIKITNNITVTGGDRRRRVPKKGGLDTKKLRARADGYRKVKTVIARGGSANEARREAQIGRDKALGYARQARAELGLAGGPEDAA